MKSSILYIVSLLQLFFLTGCEIYGPKQEDGMMEWASDPYPAAVDSAYFLISDSLGSPTSAQKNTPVIIAAHGFSATTFEWQEFRDYADALSDTVPNDSSILVSQVLLGSHGLTYEKFRKGTWRDWQKPIMKEYHALVNLGFKNISLAGSSTGGTLMLELLSSNAFKGINSPKHVFLIDPIIVPGSKLLTLADLIGPVYGNDVTENTPAEMPHWYSNRPSEALAELMDLLTVVRRQLEEGIKLPAETRMKVYKAKKDASAHPVSALLIFNGVRDSRGNYVQIKIVDSDKHVFTRGDGRSSWIPEDQALQHAVFQEMRNLVR